MKTIKSNFFWVAAILLINNALFAKEFFMAVDGSDAQNGLSVNTAWASFDYAYTVMEPGDTLTLLDGTYTQELHPPSILSGTEDAYTTFRALHAGSVILAPTSIGDDEMEGVIYIWSSSSFGVTSYIHFDGLFAKGVGENSAISIASVDFATEAEMSHHIKITRCGAMGSALDYNVDVFDIGSVRDVFVEDCFAFGFGRKAMQIYGAIRTKVRRMVVRYDWWEGDLYKPSDPRVNMSAYNTIDATLENILAIDAGPHPAATSPDRAGLVASGNQAGGTTIEGSENVYYLGCIILNNNVFALTNGLEVNGGTGAPAKNLHFKDIIIHGADAGFNIHDNVDSISLENITTIHNTHIGIRVNPYPSYTISNVTIDRSLSTDNTYDGIYWNPDMTPVVLTNSTSVRNGDGDDVEPEYEPEIMYIPTNTPVAGHERGGTVFYRYVDGELTDEPLWPWPNEEVIKQYMCNANYLQEITDTINHKEGTNMQYVPPWCATDLTLTEYIWSYLGNPCPVEICGPDALSLAQKNNKDILIYPNPVGKDLIIKMLSNELPDYVQLFDGTGRLVLAQNTKGSSIDVSSLSSGIYFLEVLVGERVYWQQLVVQ